jgi:hypothetical protein
LAGAGLAIVTFLLTLELLSGKLPHFAKATRGGQAAVMAALLVAISPWSVTLSRVAFEANIAVLFHALGVLFFLLAVKKSPRWLLLSVTSFIMAAYTFNANRLLSPLFLVVLSIIYYRKALKHWRWWLLSAGFGVLLLWPMTNHLRSPEGSLRWREVNIFSNLEVIETSNARRARAGGSSWARLVHHRYVGYTRLFLRHYLEHFDLNYLFLDGDQNPRISIPDMGQLYLIELPFLVLGSVWVLKESVSNNKNAVVLLVWFLLAAVPAGLARETPHALRSASTLPIPHIISAIGLVSVVEKLRKNG